ncbi:hypothetical protein VTH06DRAFT_2881 [Thermothelomyces fergusii]
MNYSKKNPGCPATRCNLIMYHLVSLNTVTDFSEIEKLARREELGGLQWELPVRHGKSYPGSIQLRGKMTMEVSDLRSLFRS